MEDESRVLQESASSSDREETKEPEEGDARQQPDELPETTQGEAAGDTAEPVPPEDGPPPAGGEAGEASGVAGSPEAGQPGPAGREGQDGDDGAPGPDPPGPEREAEGPPSARDTPLYEEYVRLLQEHSVLLRHNTQLHSKLAGYFHKKEEEGGRPGQENPAVEQLYQQYNKQQNSPKSEGASELDLVVQTQEKLEEVEREWQEYVALHGDIPGLSHPTGRGATVSRQQSQEDELEAGKPKWDHSATCKMELYKKMQIIKQRKKMATTVEVLAHVKERLHWCHQEKQAKGAELVQLKAERARKKSKKSRARQALSRLRAENLELEQQCGLDNSMLRQDYEDKVKACKDLEDGLESLKLQYEQAVRNLEKMGEA